jgi:ribosome-binding factor A
LEGVPVTVTEVRISTDLRNATAYVIPFGGGRSEALVAALNRAAAYIRVQLARQVKLRYAPAVRFEIDRSFDHASRIDQLLQDPRVARDVADSGRKRLGGSGDDDGGRS